MSRALSTLRTWLRVEPPLVPEYFPDHSMWSAWRMLWPLWRPRRGWWIVEAHPSGGDACALIIQDGAQSSALALPPRKVSKRVLRFSGRGPLRLHIIPTALGACLPPKLVFAQCTARFAKVRMLAKLSRQATRGLLSKSTFERLRLSSATEIWPAYDDRVGSRMGTRLSVKAVAEDLAERTDILAALRVEEESRLDVARNLITGSGSAAKRGDGQSRPESP